MAAYLVLMQQAHGVDLGGLQRLRGLGLAPAVEQLGEELAARQGGEDDVSPLAEEGILEAQLVPRRLLDVEVAARGSSSLE